MKKTFLLFIYLHNINKIKKAKFEQKYSEFNYIRQILAFGFLNLKASICSWILFSEKGYMAMSSKRRSSSKPKHRSLDDPHTQIISSLPGPVCTTPATSLQVEIVTVKANSNQLKKSLTFSFRQEAVSRCSLI